MAKFSPIKIPVTLEIVTPVLEVERMMLQAIRDIFNKGLPKVAELVQKDLQQNISRVITETNEYESLILGPLNAHFGLEKGSELGRLDDIISVLAKSIRVIPIRVAVRGKKLTGGLRIGMFQADFQDILNIPSAFVHTAKGEVLPWLEWLLLRGDQIIIVDYRIDFANHPQSRSGEAIMIKDQSSIWRVPPGVSGDKKANWITRAVKKHLGFITKLVTASVDRNLDKVL